MAALTPSEAATDAACFLCVSEKTLQAMTVYLLGQILIQSDSEANVTPEEVANASRCFQCLSGKTLIAAQVYLLTQIFENGGGGGGGSLQVFEGSGPPSGVQTGMNGARAALYYDIDPGGFLYHWNVTDQSWF